MVKSREKILRKQRVPGNDPAEEDRIRKLNEPWSFDGPVFSITVNPLFGGERRTYQIHDHILVRQSEYFKRMLDSTFAEGRDRECRLLVSEAEASCFNRVVEFLYRGEYNSARTSDVNAFALHAVVIKLAQKYDINVLADYAYSQLEKYIDEDQVKPPIRKLPWEHISEALDAISEDTSAIGPNSASANDTIQTDGQEHINGKNGAPSTNASNEPDQTNIELAVDKCFSRILCYVAEEMERYKKNADFLQRMRKGGDFAVGLVKSLPSKSPDRATSMASRY